MISKRRFFKQLLGTAIAVIAPVVMEFPITHPVISFDVHSQLVAQMTKEIQDEIDRDIITRMMAMENCVETRQVL